MFKPGVVSGNLSLVCSADPERGCTYISSQTFSAPFHLSKSFWDGNRLLINVVNQTAGIFGGDTLTSHVVVEPGAQVLLTCPSAGRFHPSRGRKSRLEQRFEIRAGGFLEVFPQLSIPQRDSNSNQKTEIVCEAGSELIYFEAFAPGRVASGEIFTYSRYAWSTNIRVADRLIYRERGDIRPMDQPSSLVGLQALFPASYYASFVIVSTKAESWRRDFAEQVKDQSEPASMHMGASQLAAHGWSVRVLASNSLALHDAVQKVRSMIYERLGKVVPELRRY